MSTTDREKDVLKEKDEMVSSDDNPAPTYTESATWDTPPSLSVISGKENSDNTKLVKQTSRTHFSRFIHPLTAKLGFAHAVKSHCPRCGTACHACHPKLGISLPLQPSEPTKTYRARLLCHLDGTKTSAHFPAGSEPPADIVYMKFSFPHFLDEPVYPLQSRRLNQELELAYNFWDAQSWEEFLQGVLAVIGDLGAFKLANLDPSGFLIMQQSKVSRGKTSTKELYSSRTSILMLPIHASEYITTGYDYACVGDEGAIDIITVTTPSITWKMPSRYRKYNSGVQPKLSDDVPTKR